MKRIALYARVSTKNGSQDPETQLVALREYAQQRGLQTVGEYVDVGISGAKDRRPQLEHLMKAARRRQIDAVVVARFDRFARSVRHLVMALDEFHGLGVEFISLSEAVGTSTPMGRMVFTVIGAVAELARSLIRERVMMGLNRAKAKGKKLGRPSASVDLDKAAQLRAEGLTYQEIGGRFGVSRTTVSQLLRSGSPT